MSVQGPDQLTPLSETSRIDPSRLFTPKGAQFEPVKSARPRIGAVALALVAVALVLMARAADLAIFSVAPALITKSQQPAVLPARARIVDRNHVLLAGNLRTWNVYVQRHEIDNPVRLADRLAMLPDMPSATVLEQRFTGTKGRARIARNVTPKHRQALFDLAEPGMEFEPVMTRSYPAGSLASHVLGWVNADASGASGIEKSMNASLQTPDDELVLSIDSRVQFTLEDELRAAVQAHDPLAAIGLVTNIKTGEVLAMASLPDFDPNHFGTALPDHRRNRAVTDPYELGSVFKPITLAMALESGMELETIKMDVASPLVIAGRKIRDFHPGPSPMNGQDILVHSSNKGAAKLALAVGQTGQQMFLSEFGLFERSSVEINGTAAAFMASTDWSKIKTATIGYGHGLSVTAASYVEALGGVVNDGNRVNLTLLKRAANDVDTISVVSAATSYDVRASMRKVVTAGTGGKADVPGYGVAGKTGSAEKWDPQSGSYARDRNVSSFVGIFPWEAPQYMVFILLDEPKGGRATYGWETAGWNAAPAVGAVIRRIGPLLNAPYSNPDRVRDQGQNARTSQVQ